MAGPMVRGYVLSSVRSAGPYCSNIVSASISMNENNFKHTAHSVLHHSAAPNIHFTMIHCSSCATSHSRFPHAAHLLFRDVYVIGFSSCGPQVIYICLRSASSLRVLLYVFVPVFVAHCILSSQVRVFSRYRRKDNKFLSFSSTCYSLFFIY